MDWWFEGSERLRWVVSLVLGSGSMVDTKGSSVLDRLTCLEATMVGSSGVRTGSWAVWLCLWWRRLLLCSTYLLVDVGQHGAWVLFVLGGLLFSGLMLAYCFVCCLSRLVYVSLADYHLMMRHDGLYAC